MAKDWEYIPSFLEISSYGYKLRFLVKFVWKPEKYLRYGVGYGNHLMFLCFEFIWMNKK